MTLTEFLAELEARAKAATPGPWYADGDCVVDVDNDEVLAETCLPDRLDADAAYIASLPPEVVLALVKCARALEQAAAERDRITATVEAMNTEDTPMAIPGNPYRDALAALERAAEGKG